jgi:hypothetical protein
VIRKVEKCCEEEVYGVLCKKAKENGEIWGCFGGRRKKRVGGGLSFTAKAFSVFLGIGLVFRLSWRIFGCVADV